MNISEGEEYKEKFDTTLSEAALIPGILIEPTGGEVYITNMYDKFLSLEGNRGIMESHVKKIMDSIEEKNQLQYFPIMVNENNYIIDGQHRLRAAERLGVPIYYRIIKGADINDVMRLNFNQKQWSLMNFIQAYIHLGYSEYIKLQEFFTKYTLSPNSSARLLYGWGTMGTEISNVVRGGEFKVRDLEKAEKVAYVRSYIEEKI